MRTQQGAPVARLKSPPLAAPVTNRRRNPPLVVLPVVHLKNPPLVVLPVAHLKSLPLAVLLTRRKTSQQPVEVPAELATNKIDIHESMIFLVWPKRESSGFTRLGDFFYRNSEQLIKIKTTGVTEHETIFFFPMAYYR